MATTNDKPDPMHAVVELHPVHLLPRRARPEGIAGRRGRPRKIETAPEPDPYLVALDRLRQEAIAGDPLVAGGDGVDALRLAMIELAREAAALGHERRRLDSLGRDSCQQVASRKVDALVRLAALEVERVRHQPPDLDVGSEIFQRAVASFLQVFEDAARESLSQEEAARFVAVYKERLKGWEDVANPPPSRRPG